MPSRKLQVSISGVDLSKTNFQDTSMVTEETNSRAGESDATMNQIQHAGTTDFAKVLCGSNGGSVLNRIRTIATADLQERPPPRFTSARPQPQDKWEHSGDSSEMQSCCWETGE